jgi:hypothetical protein
MKSNSHLTLKYLTELGKEFVQPKGVSHAVFITREPIVFGSELSEEALVWY